MTYFHTCKTCRVRKADCEVRAKLAAAIAGLGVASLKHKCSAHVPVFSPGAPIEVLTVPYLGNRGSEEDEGPPPKHWYCGHFIRYSGASLIVFVKAGSKPMNSQDWDAFEPSGAGFIKAPSYRVRPSTWASPVNVDECSHCGAITNLGQPCGSGPFFGQPAPCQQLLGVSVAEAPGQAESK